MRFAKMACLERVFRNIIKRDQVLKALFDDNPELESFSFTKTQEYDDNNYYTSTVISSINGHDVDSDGAYSYDEEEQEENSLPRVPQEVAWKIAESIDDIGGYFDEDDESIDVYREDYDDVSMPSCGKIKFDLKDDESKYADSFFNGTVLPDSFFIKADPRFAVWYADDHGRFSPEVETKIFAQKGRMSDAFHYALHVLKAPLPTDIENFFTLHASLSEKKAHKEDFAYFKRYLKWKETLEEEKSAKKKKKLKSST